MKYVIQILILSTCISCAAKKTIDKSKFPFQIQNLIPWSIVAFDNQERNPIERVEMIKELGFSQYAFGGRQKHINTFPEEIKYAKENNITISAVWLYLNNEKDTPGQLRKQNEQILTAVNEAGITPQIWVGFNPNYFAEMTDEAAFTKGKKMVSYLSDRANELGCIIGLYNHGGWMGNPENQLQVLRAIDRKNIGIVYNFHHGHDDIDRYKELFPKLIQHLLCVNLNGMEKAGKKILTIGQGEYERDMISELQKLGYKGPWGILGHVKGGDAKEILKQNLVGLTHLDKPRTKKKTKNSTKKRVFLFAGQSNMDGRADAAGISDEDLKRLHKIKDRVLFHYNKMPAQDLAPVIPKKHIKRKFNLEKSFGPELFFGIHLAEAYPQDTFIFIKRSQGGTSLHGCWNPNWTLEKATLMEEENQPKLFSDFIAYTTEVLSELDNSYEIGGLLWVQGENDSSKKRGPIPAEMYYSNLKNLIHSTRTQLNTPNLPMYIFQVGHGKVVQAMKRLSQEDPNVYFIPQSKDKTSPYFFEKNPPPIGHYTAKSMKKIGKLFFVETCKSSL